jgi:hypothetical protein
MSMVFMMVLVNCCSCVCCGAYLAEPAVLPVEAPFRCQATVCAGPGVGNACASATRPKAALPELGARGLLAGVLIVIAPSSSCGHVLPALVYQQVALGPSLHFIGVQDPGVLPQHIHVRLFTDTFVGSADESRLTAFNFNSLL